MSVFEKFNKQVDLKGMQEDIKKAMDNDGDFEEVPTGKYEVEVEKLELVTTKSEPVRPMLTIWFNVLVGEFKNSKIFYNQTMYSKTGEYAGMMTGFCNKMLESLDSGVEIVFEDYVQYENLVLDVHEAIEGKKEYVLEKSLNKAGYDVFEIKQVFDK